MADTLQDILAAKGKCCITGKPLADSIYIHVVNLNVQAQWDYPVWGNILSGQEGMAIAAVHDDAIVDGQPAGIIIHAIQITGPTGKKEIIYHDIADLKR